MAGKKWINKAIKKPGSLRRTAKREGLVKGKQDLSQADLKKLEKSGSAKTRRRAHMADTLKKMRKS